MAPSKKKPPADEQRVMSVRLLTSNHRRARIYAVTNGRTLADVLNEALDEYLRKRGA